jgi:hypothetical protein
MRRMEDIVDFYFSEEGDLQVGDDGDLKDTKLDAYRGFIQQIDTIVKSSSGDWGSLGIGANLSKFLGTKNTAGTGKAIEQSVHAYIAREGLVSMGDIRVQVLPVSESMITIFIFVRPTGSKGNLVLTYYYDMRDNKIATRLRR